MAIIQGNAKQGSVRGFYPKVINGSLRFNDDDSAYLSWTPVGTGDSQKKFTTSFWVKRANLAESYLFSIGSSTADRIFLRLDSADNLDFFCQVSSTTVGRYTTSRVFRDTSAWYHIVVAVDTSLANADSIKVYVNGERDSTNPSTNFNNQSTVFGTQVIHTIGTSSWTLGSTNCDSYLADFYCIDNAQLTASDFGETKNGVWVAKDYAGTFGTNGFYLTFEDDTQVEAFNTVLYRGDGSGSQSITGMGFKPELLWLKRRNAAGGWNCVDVIRGVDKRLELHSTGGDFTQTVLQSFDSDGFTTGVTGVGETNGTYVAFGWKAGGTPTVDNSAGAGNVPTAGSVKIDGVNSTSALAGSIPATRLSASTTYGFSIVSYTGTGSAATIGHGLSSAPDLIICKNRDELSHWDTYHSSIGSAYRVQLSNTTAQEGPSTVYWNSTDPTSSVFSVGNGLHTNGSGDKLIAYCWSETTGYSKFGSYAGDSTTDGSNAINVGFKPALVMIKHYEDTAGTYNGDWFIYDNTRDVPDGDSYLRPNLSSAETANGGMLRLTDTGFALYTNSGSHNETNNNYIYAAFADTREAAFWLDQSGNDNDWQPVNLDHNDTVADSPTNNFCTFNPLRKGANFTLSDGNLKAVTNATVAQTVAGTFGMSSGQWYWEVTNEGGSLSYTGIVDENHEMSTYIGAASYGSGYAYNTSGQKVGPTSGTAVAYGATYTAGDVIGVALDMDAGTLTFYKNGVSQGTAFTGLTGTWFPAVSGNGVAGKGGTANFGQQPFKYDPPA